MKRVDQFVVFQCIGREAGWLPAATALGKKDLSDAPHIICFPERKFNKDNFLADVKRCYDEYGYVSVVCGEGITYPDGTPVSASQTKDKFNNVEFGAMGGTSAAISLHKMISAEFGFRGEFQVTESLPMCAQDRAVAADIDEAWMCGHKAVELAAAGKTGVMITLERIPGSTYKCTTGTAPLEKVAVHAKPMPDDFINAQGNWVTEKFLEYARPLVGELPDYVRLQEIKYNL
jgi:6-phosphofructokinase 1